MTSEDHVKKVHGTSTRQDVFSALPAVGKINGLAYVSNFPLPLPPLVCQASSSLPPEAMAGWPSTSALLEAAQTRFAGANTWRYTILIYGERNQLRKNKLFLFIKEETEFLKKKVAQAR